jgi:anti-sigma regulatory factor (Ser/Thr protein kinase)
VLAISNLTCTVTTFVFPGKYESLADIDKFVRESAQKAGFDSFGVYAVETSVDEACSNIIEHAYGAEGIGDITCTVTIEKEGLTIVLVDNGQPFDPDSIPPPNLSDNLYDREDHGLGIYIMRKWMDEVRFEYTNGTNITTLIKRREKKN